MTSSIAALGLSSIASGIYLQIQENKKQNNLTHQSQTKEEKLKLILKNIKIKQNEQLPTEIESYVKSSVKTSIREKLKLDVSEVDTTTVGTYYYTISYKGQTFKGKIIVEESDIKIEKEEDELQQLTLKEISLKLGEKIPNDPSYYVVETLTEEVKNNIKLDLSQIIINKAGTYQYSITYKETFYTGKITLIEDKPVITSPKQEQTEEETDDNYTETDKTDKDENLETTSVTT